jgi:hypothetical protein
MMGQHWLITELKCIILVRLIGAMYAKTVTFREHAM